jgi:selenoprotein W-related protein
MKAKPRVQILFCPKCKWLFRAAWLAQELLSTFESVVGEVALAPAGSGVFQVFAEGELVWDRKIDGGFPQAKELKRRVRDVISPEKDLGHSDRDGDAIPNTGSNRQ